MHRSAVEHESRCPLWVKSEHHGAFDQCLLYPRKQTLELSHGMSALCQKRTSRLHALWNKSANSHLDFMALRKLEPSELHRQEAYRLQSGCCPIVPSMGRVHGCHL